MTTVPERFDRLAAIERAARRSNYPYAWRYGWRWVLTSRTLLTALRCLYWTYLRGWDGEACWFCGRPYVLWRAPDDLWAKFSGNSGLCCPSCFDQRARAEGVVLIWSPAEFSGWTPELAHMRDKTR